MSHRKKRALAYIAVSIATIGVYVWHVRGISEVRVLDVGSARPAGDVTHGQWSVRAGSSVSHAGAGAAPLGGMVYLVGGVDSVGKPLAEVEAYDPKADAWERVADIPKAPGLPAVTSDEDYVYAFGGLKDDGTPSDSSFVFDPVVGIWQGIAPLPEGRAAAAAVALGDRVYVAGGESFGKPSDDLFEYDPAIDRWAILEPMPEARASLSLVALGGKIYAIGGGTGAVDVYDPSKRQWSSAAPLPYAASGGAAVAYKGSIVHFGGADGKRVSQEAYAYDPTRGGWERMTRMIAPRHGMGAAVVDGAVYLVGGGTRPGLSVSNALEAFAYGGELSGQ